MTNGDDKRSRHEAGDPKQSRHEAGDPKQSRHEAGDPKLDLSALDPTRDELRFERMVHSLASQAVQQRLEQADPWGFTVRLWRPALALAASLALLAWAPSLLGSAASTASTAPKDPGTTLLSWAAGEGPTSAADVIATFGRTP